jgi:hypothetical protein
LIELFSGAELPCDLRDAEIHATLRSGATVVAKFNRNHRGRDDDDDDDDDEGDDDAVADRNAGTSPQGQGLRASVQPNPFNPSTELSFSMAREGRVRVTIYDLHGRVVKALVDEIRIGGEHRVRWDGSNTRNETVPSGVYFLRIQTTEDQITRKLAVVK